MSIGDGAQLTELPFQSDVISLFTSRAEEYAAILRNSRQLSAGIANAVKSQAQTFPDQGGRSFLLEALQSGKVQQSLTFDVALNSCDGFAQRIAYTFNSRETTHHTAAGFYTEQYGIGPGSFDIDAEVVFTQDPSSQIETFLQFLFNSKTASPFDGTVPYVVLLTDSYLGKSLTITQTTLGIEQSANYLYRARIRMSGTILGEATTHLAPNAAPTASFGSTASTVSYIDSSTSMLLSGLTQP